MYCQRGLQSVNFLSLTSLQYLLYPTDQQTDSIHNQVLPSESMQSRSSSHIGRKRPVYNDVSIVRSSSTQFLRAVLRSSTMPHPFLQSNSANDMTALTPSTSGNSLPPMTTLVPPAGTTANPPHIPKVFSMKNIQTEAGTTESNDVFLCLHCRQKMSSDSSQDSSSNGDTDIYGDDQGSDMLVSVS